MKTNSSTRLQASEGWWDALTSEQKKLYIKQHPNSKYAKDPIGEDEEAPEEKAPEEHEESPTEDTHEESEESHEVEEVKDEHRKSVADTLRKLGPKVAKTIKHKFAKIGIAGAALKRIAAGQELEEEHKETLRELGSFTLKTLSSHVTGSPELSKVIARVGTTAVEHAIEKFKEHKEKSGKDDIDTFVDGVAEGLEKAEVKKDDKEETSIKSIGNHIKKSTNHIVDVLNKSFQHIKPATEGLDDEHKAAMKGLGKIALATSVATLPGGLAVHITASIGGAALIHAFKKMKAFKSQGHEHGILHHFVESIGEGLEDALLEHAAEGPEHLHE